MSSYEENVRCLRHELPDRWQEWVDRSRPCRCDEVWSDRGMHEQFCGWVTAVEVLWDAQADGMLDFAQFGPEDTP